MFKNYFKIAVRNLWKNKTFSLLNIAGLAIGVACAALIFLWIEDEVTYNDYFKDKDNLYQIYANQTYGGQTFTFAANPGMLAQAVKAEIPGIKNAARTTWQERSLFTIGDNGVYGNGLYVDAPFLQMFNLEFVKGNASKAFGQLYSVVLTESMAKKIFNAVDVLGKTVNLDNKQDYLVSGVIKDLPKNNKFGFVEWLSPFEIFFNQNDWLKQWGNNGIQTYLQLDEAADAKKIDNKLHGFIQAKDADAIAKPLLLSANDWRLRSNFTEGKQEGGRIKNVTLFSIIAWIILLIACINFMNLATARSQQRAKEVGVRKVMGSGKSSLIAQFMIEALVMSFIAVLFAVIITALVLPTFNSLVEKEMVMNVFSPLHITALLSTGVICGLLAGSYPAFYLSSFSPIGVLNGLKIKTGAGVDFVRKGLVVTQFVVSVALIICTIIIYQQVMHTQKRDLGINKNNLIYMSQQLISTQQGGNFGLRFQSVKNDLLHTGVVENVSLCNNSAFQVGSNSGDFGWKGKDPNKQVLISMEWATPEYIGTMGMKIMSGRDFYQNGLADSNNIVINETFAKLVSKKPEDVVGQLIDRNGNHLMVIGVVKDYLFDNVYGSPAPLIIFNDSKAEYTNNISLRFKPTDNYNTALSKVEAVVKKYNPAYPFEYKFVDETFQQLFQAETLIGTLAALFAGLAIFISCLGLFGLAAYTAQRRRKEISVRKILGASVQNLASLLSMDFLKLVMISCVIAFPLAWYFMNSWLQDFEYRVSISWWMFALPAFIALFIALVTVSFQAIKAALANPVKFLRTE